MNTNRAPHTHTQALSVYPTHTFTKSNYIHLLLHCDIVDSQLFPVYCHRLHKRYYHNFLLLFKESQNNPS